MKKNVYLQLTSLEEARALWLERAGTSPLCPEKVPLAEAHGRTLAVPAVAALSSPAFHGAAMDGIAIDARASFGASERRPKTLRIGKDAHWINTGRPLPAGANAVVMAEHVVAGPEGTVILEKPAFPWQHVRKLGEDMVATEILLPPGTVIGPYELGALAAAGVLFPSVFRRPRVAIIPSGSELVPLEQATPHLLGSGAKLPEFNSLILSAMVREAGGVPEVHPIAADHPEAIRDALERAAASGADLVALNAGSSAGSHDFTPGIIAELGELWVHGITLMPGKPTALGRVKSLPVIGVPGYPVSAIISFEEFGQSLLAAWQGRRIPERPAAEAAPYQALPSRPGMEERVRVKLGEVDGRLVAVPLPRGAGTVTSLSRADGIISIPAPVEGVPAAAPAPVTLLRSRDHIRGALLAIGSHDNTLDLLDSLLRKTNPRFSLASAHVGSLGGLLALKEKRCHLAGTHLLDPETGQYNRAAIVRHLPDVPIMLMRLADREQGLILPPGNPAEISGLADLVRPDMNFVNRQRGSGTRVLLDRELQRLGIAPHQVAGYEEEEYTHMAVAAAVLSGRAGAGLGVRAAANALGLDFLPVGVEEYDLAIPAVWWDDPRMQALRATVASPEFKEAARAMGGYDTGQTGRVVWTWQV